jgi:hypothetical protein
MRSKESVKRMVLELGRAQFGVDIAESDAEFVVTEYERFAQEYEAALAELGLALPIESAVAEAKQ